ncbi:MAG TPA: ribokinase [Anaerolineales bacterium]|nr:ribokinase [Anaerolineales bacterium]
MSRRNTPDIVVIGGANMDYLIRGEKLPQPGETAKGDLFQEAPGGKGANQAVAATRLGARVAFIARVGADRRGREIVKRLKEEGVNTKFIVRDQIDHTGVALVMVGGDGEKQILSVPGANDELSVDQVRRAAAAIQAARVLLTQLEVPLETLLLAARLAREAGAKVLLDPSPPTSLPDELMQLVSLIKPNAREAEALTGILSKDRDSARKAAQRLIERGVGSVAVQAGDDGNLILTPEQEYWFPRIPVQSIDATGAGDAFAAGLAVGLLEERPWPEIGALASAAAALTTTKLGAQAGLPTREQVSELLKKEETKPAK